MAILIIARKIYERLLANFAWIIFEQCQFGLLRFIKFNLIASRRYSLFSKQSYQAASTIKSRKRFSLAYLEMQEMFSSCEFFQSVSVNFDLYDGDRRAWPWNSQDKSTWWISVNKVICEQGHFVLKSLSGQTDTHTRKHTVNTLHYQATKSGQ